MVNSMLKIATMVNRFHKRYLFTKCHLAAIFKVKDDAVWARHGLRRRLDVTIRRLEIVTMRNFVARCRRRENAAPRFFDDRHGFVTRRFVATPSQENAHRDETLY
jgi:hypothetical protein